MMCVLLGIFGFLFLCNLDGKCVPFIVSVTYQNLLKVATYIEKIATFVARCFFKEKVARVVWKVLQQNCYFDNTA